MSEQLYYLKDDVLYKVISGGLHEIPMGGVDSIDDKCSLIIDDTYFFYQSMDNVSATGKKLHAVARGFLSTQFPQELIENYGVLHTNNTTLIYMMSEQLISMIAEYPVLFSRPKRVSTPFIEMVSMHGDFNYSDGSKVYKKVGGEISLQISENDYVTSKDFFADYVVIRNNIALQGVKKATIFNKSKFIVPAVAIALVYIIFVAGQIVSMSSVAKIDEHYSTILSQLYKANDVANTSDPYGVLLYRAGGSGANEDRVQVLEVLQTLDTIKDISDMRVINIRDNDIRIEGIAVDFAQIDNIKQQMAEKMNKEVSISDTKVVDNGVSFVMRYEY